MKITAKISEKRFFSRTNDSAKRTSTVEQHV